MESFKLDKYWNILLFNDKECWKSKMMKVWVPHNFIMICAERRREWWNPTTQGQPTRQVRSRTTGSNLQGWSFHSKEFYETYRLNQKWYVSNFAHTFGSRKNVIIFSLLTLAIFHNSIYNKSNIFAVFKLNIMF